MNNDDKEIHSLLNSYWSIQNSILQSCRQMFVAAGAILLSFAIASAEHNVVIGFIPLGILLGFLWIWTIKDRGYNDSYFRWKILKFENSGQVPEKVLSDFRDWQHKPTAQKRKELSCDDQFGKPLLQSKTRRVLDCWLPLGYLVCWLLLSVWICLDRNCMP